MKKKVILIVSVLFILIIVSSIVALQLRGNNQSKVSSDNSVLENNNLSNSKDENTHNEDTKSSDLENVHNVTEFVESIHVKDMKSLDDITEDMIRQRTVGYNMVGYSSNYSDDSFKISVRTFSGCDFSKKIHTENETEVTIKYTTTMKEDSVKIALIVEAQVIAIPLEQSEFTYTLPRGDTIIAIWGYKASGDIEMTLDTIDDVKFIQNTEF